MPVERRISKKEEESEKVRYVNVNYAHTELLIWRNSSIVCAFMAFRCIEYRRKRKKNYCNNNNNNRGVRTIQAQRRIYTHYYTYEKIKN